MSSSSSSSPSSTSGSMGREDATKNEQDFVTVVSVGSQSASATAENFVTVLSIGNDEKNDRAIVGDRGTTISNASDVHPEEQVEVFRLPGEPLGFGLKFDGGAKNAEKVKRLFVQSCAEQSPASRAKCSWGTIGEGDEVLSIDGVPVTHMSRLDCVRRLKESQLVIKLLIRCRGALRPEVVSAERKSSPEISPAKTEKSLPALPSLPPPVPPRKLRHARGSADGEANPIPAKKIWNDSPKSTTSGSSSQTDSPQSRVIANGSPTPSNGKSSFEDSTNSVANGSPKSTIESTKRCNNETSMDIAKSKMEPPEAMSYLDARSQDGSSTHGSTSDDTGSSLSTVVDRFSTSDRFSTVSTASTTSGGASDNHGCRDRSIDDHTDETIVDYRENVVSASPFEQLEKDFLTNSTDYLLKRLASSEAVTHVESRGEAGGVVERITAVVAPNTVVIEETMTLQPPLSFQDAPLSYGHEKTPGIIYTADLAGDSTTHFRPISDEAAIVERVNGDSATNVGPTLPERNHVNRISINQDDDSSDARKSVDTSREIFDVSEKSCEPVAPILPPKPMPRKDVKSKRKRPPPPPPPPPRREPPPPVPVRAHVELPIKTNGDVTVIEITNSETNDSNDSKGDEKMANFGRDEVDVRDDETMTIDKDRYSLDKGSMKIDQGSVNTNKVLEIIEMKKIKAFGECTPNRSPVRTIGKEIENNDGDSSVTTVRRVTEVVAAPREKKKIMEIRRDSTLLTEIDDSETSSCSASENWQDAKERQDVSENPTMDDTEQDGGSSANVAGADGLEKMVEPSKSNDVDKNDGDDDDDETYRSLDEIREDFKSSETNGTLSSSDEEGEDVGGNGHKDGDSTSDDSEDNGDDDYYWQSNLATIGEEEETSSLEYTIANRDSRDAKDRSTIVGDEGRTEFRGSPIETNESTINATAIDATRSDRVTIIAKDFVEDSNGKLGAQVNAGRMENCGGDQRLPPDGDEFPTTYQEFSGCTSDQYQYQTPTTRTPQSRNNVATTNADRDRVDDAVDNDDNDDDDETSASAGSTNYSPKNRNETSKSPRTDSFNDKKSTIDNNTTNATTIRDKNSSPYVRTGNSRNSLLDVKPTSRKYVGKNSSTEIGIAKLEIVTKNNVEDGNDDRTIESSSFEGSNCRATKFSDVDDSVVRVVGEKKLEISNYHSKDGKNCLETNFVESSEAAPPPLPLTGPPKSENLISTISRNIGNPTELSPQRKFSSNGDLWRQDDKSEKSVRDKIAMFSSQSSLENPLFPNRTTSVAITTMTNVANNGRRLSKYKSSEDVFCDDKIYDDNERFAVIERTRSSVDLTDSRKIVIGNDENSSSPIVEIDREIAKETLPILPKNLPPDDVGADRFSGYSNKSATTPIATGIREKSASSTIDEISKIGDRNFGSFDYKNSSGKIVKPVVPPRIGNSSIGMVAKKSIDDEKIAENSTRTATTSLARATSFSGESNYTNDFSQFANAEITTGNGQISRTNSLASTFRRNSEDMRRQSLNQLIEQRRKGISKLRGLVIPEKNSLPIDKPIMDLPEIKSRDSILMNQIPKATIHDKWGSQSSIASNASSSSTTGKSSSSFKMPAPQIMSKYSPAFKRKTLAVYGTSIGNSSIANAPVPIRRSSPTNNQSSLIHDSPKSLESICSPTRSDCSFEFVSSTSVSPDVGISRIRPRSQQRKIRLDYDDSDNDSAVSSSQSSVSRGFSPPTSPAPSERSSLSSERSYHTSLIMNVPLRNYSNADTSVSLEKNRYHANGIFQGENRGCSSSNRSSSSNSSNCSSSSSCATPNPRSPQSETNMRNSQIPQRHLIKRSSSTETNCSTASSSTLTSGSQTSGESLSRRVLKPQSVEAINRKNILASAKCRSGRDHNGSPLIQRKFSDDEELPISGLARDNGNCDRDVRSNVGDDDDDDRGKVKIAYIEVTEIVDDDVDSTKIAETKIEEIPKISDDAKSGSKSTDNDLMEASNDLKMWVRSEAKALMAEMPKSVIVESPKIVSSISRVIVEPIASVVTTTRNRSSIVAEENRFSSISDGRTKIAIKRNNDEKSVSRAKSKSLTRGDFVDDDDDDSDAIVGDASNDDVSTISTRKNRSRSTIDAEERKFSRATRQMSLEDILIGKNQSKLGRQNSTNSVSGNEKSVTTQYRDSQTSKFSHVDRTTSNDKDVWSDDKSFVSKIPMLGRSNNRGSTETIDDIPKSCERSRSSKIPQQRTLDRRSASVTDVKRAVEKTDATASLNSSTIGNGRGSSSIGAHQRFSSLDSSVEERGRILGRDQEIERSNGEQFGSISSLASSTSLISQQELAQLVEDASSLEDGRVGHDVVVVLLHKENPHGSVGITLAGGTDCEVKEITVHRVLAHSVADKDGRVQRGDRILSINGRSTRGLNHRDSLAVLKQPRSEVVLVVSRSRNEETNKLKSRTDSVETIVEGSEACGTLYDTAWGPATRVAIFKDGAGLGFSLAGGRDSPLGDRPLVIKKIFTGGAAEKTAALTAGDQLLEVNGTDVTRMSRIEAWSLMKKLTDGEANLLVRHPATKSS